MTEEIRQLRETLERNPDDIRAFRALEQLYRDQHDWRGLVGLYQEHPPNGADGAPTFAELAAGLEGIKGDLDSKQERGHLLVALGDVYIQHLDRREDAMAAYQASFKAWPKDTTCLERARSIYSDAGDFDRVIVLYELQTKVLKKMNRASDLARTYVEMAEVFGEKMSDEPRAIEKVLDARDIDPAGDHGVQLLARYNSAPSVVQKIIELLDQAEELASVNAREAARLLVRAARLECVRDGGEFEAAYLYAERAIEYDGENQDAARLLEQILTALDEVQSNEFDRNAQEVTGPIEVDPAELDARASQEEDAYVLEEIEPDAEDEAEELDVAELEEIEPDAEVAEEAAGGGREVEEIEPDAEDEAEELAAAELEEIEPDAEGDEADVVEEIDEELLEQADSSQTMMLSPDDYEHPIAPDTEEGEEREPAEESAEENDEDEQEVELEEIEPDAEGEAEELDVAELEEIEPDAEEVAAEETVALEGEEPEEAAEVEATEGVEEVAEEEVAEEVTPEEDVAEVAGEEEVADEAEEVSPEERLPDPASIAPIGDEELEAALAALKKEPADLETIGVVQRELIRRGEWDELVDRLEHSVRYLRRKDGEFDVMLDLAVILWKKKGDMDRAEYFFKRLRHHDSELPEMQVFYEEYYEHKGQWRKLHVHLNAALQHASTEAEARRYTERMAQIAEVEMGSPEKAIEAWRHFLSEHPGDDEARHELRRLYEEHEKWKALVDYLRDELRTLEEGDDPATIPDRVALLEEMSAIYRDRVPGGDINRINALNQLLELDPGHRAGFEELKELLEGNRRFSELASLLSEQADAAAEQGDLGRAIGLLTEVADLWQERLNNITQALPFLQRIIELDPTHGPTRERLKEVYEQRRDYPSLFELLEQETPEKAGDELEAHLRQLLELAQDRLRDMERAVPLLEQLLELAPSGVELYEKLEYIYRRQESWEALAALLERKAELDVLSDADVINAYKEAAQLCDTRLELPDRAAELWRRVLALDEGNATAFARLRDIFIEHRRFDDLFELFLEREQLDRYYDVLGNVAGETEDAAGRCEVFRRMATLAEKHLSDDARVIASLERLLADSEDRPAVARELIGWYRQVGDLASEIEMHKLLLEHATDELDRFAELVRLAELEIEREEDEAALRWQLEAVAVIPSEEGAVQQAEDLARHVSMLELFLDHLEAIAEAQEEGSALQRDLWHRVARLSRDELEDNARAIELFERLKALEPEELAWLEALEALYEVAAYPERRIATLREMITLLEDQGAPEGRVVEQLSKIADVQHRHLGEQDAALESYQRILDLDPDFVPAIEGLREIYSLEGRWDDVIAMLERQFDLVGLGDDEQRNALRMELARIWRDFKEEPAEALRYYSDVLAERPTDEAALARAEELLEVDAVAADAARLLEPLLRDSAQHERLANALEARLRVCQDEFEEQEILEELVPLYIDSLEDLEAAFPRACRRFELDASNEARWRELEELAEALDRWPDVEQLFSAWCPFSEEDVERHGGRVELLRHVAIIREQRLEDEEGALEAWERLHDFEAMDLGVIAALERLYQALTRVAPLVKILEVKADVITAPGEQVALLMRAASLTDTMLEDASGAIVLYQRVLELDPTHGEAVSSLERLLRQEERFFDLDELLASQANLAGDAAGRRNFLLQQAALRTNQLDDAPGAFAILRDLIAEDSSDPRAVMLLVNLDRVIAEGDPQAMLRLDIALELDALYRDREDYPKLIEVLEVRLTFTEETFERIGLLDELAELYLTRVGDQTSSFERTREAVVLMPDEVERRERFERLGEKLDRLDDVVAAYAEAALEADPFVAAPLHRRSGEILAERLMRHEDAIDAYEKALAIDDNDEEALGALEHLYEQTGRNEALSENLRMQARYADPDRRVALFQRIGILEEQILNRPIEAIDAWSEMLNAAPTSMEAIEALERLHESEEQWFELSEILRKKADLVEEDAFKLQVLHKLALTYEEKLEDIQEAINVYQQMLILDRKHPDALDALDALFLAESRWVDLADVLREKLSLEAAASDDALRTELELRLARILGDELMSVDDSLDLYLAVFERHPGQEDARVALERWAEDVAFSERCASPLINYYQHEGLWRELVELYTTLCDQNHDPESQADYQWKIALIERDHLPGLPEAQEAMSRAWRLQPHRDDWRGELVALAEVRESWRELAEVYEDVLMQVSDMDRMKTLRVELAVLYRDMLDNAVDAELQFQEALNLDERDLGVYEALEDMFTGQERWQDLIDVLERRYMVFAAEPDAKALLLRMASVHDEFLQDGFTAVEAYRRVLGVDPRDETAQAAINRLLRDQGREQDLADFLEDQSNLYADEPARLVAIKTELAELYADKLFSPERALELWREILALEHHHPATIASLERMFEEDEAMRPMVSEVLEPIYREQGAWDRFRHLLRVKADNEPDPLSRVELLRELARVCEVEQRAWADALATYGEIFALVPEQEDVRQAFTRIAERLQAWGDVVEVYETTMAENYNVGDMLRGGLLLELGLVREERLGELEAARRTYAEILEVDPANEHAFDALERINVRLEDWVELGELYRLRAEAEFDPTARIQWLERLATLQEEVIGDPDEAIMVYEQMLEIEITDRHTQRALERMLRSTQRFDDLANLYRRLMDLSDDPEQRIQMRYRLAQLVEGELDEVDEALDLYRSILMEAPGHRDTLSALEGLRRDLAARDGDWSMHLLQIADLLLEHYDVSRDWRRIVELLELKQAVTEDEHERFGLLDLAAGVVEEHASERADLFQALTLRTQAWCLLPERQEGFDKLEAIADRLESWERVVPQVLEGLEFTEAPEEQARLLNNAARVYLDKLHDTQSALLAYEQTLAVDPTNAEAIQQLEGLYGQFEHWEPLVELLRLRLDNTFDGDARVTLLQRIANLHEQVLDRPHEAIASYEELREIDPNTRSYLDALSVLYERTEQDELLVDVLQAKVNMLEDPGERLGTFKKLAQVQHEILGDEIGAIDTYRQILALDDEDELAVRALIGLYTSSEQWHELLEMLNLEREFAGEIAQLDQIEFRMAEIMIDRVDQPYDALEVLKRITSRSPQWEPAVEVMTSLLDNDMVREEAFSSLEALHRDAARWESLAALYEKRIGYLDDPHQRTGTYLKLASLQEEQLDNPPMALMTYGRAFRELPSQESVRTQLERLAESQSAWDELIAVYEDALEGGVDDPIARKGIHSRLGELYVEEREEAAPAIRHMEAVLALDEYDLSALELLDRLYQYEERWDDLADIIERKIAVVSPDEIAQARFRLGYLREVIFERPLDAFDLYRQVIVEQPDHRGVNEALERLIENPDLKIEVCDLLEDAYTRTENWGKLSQLLRIKLDGFVEGPHERAEMMRRVAELERTRLDNPEAAFQFYGQALAADPFDLGTQERLEELVAEQGYWSSIVDLYDGLITDLDDPIRQSELALRAANWSMNVLEDDLDRAHRLYTLVLDVEPRSEDALNALEAIARQRADMEELASVLARKVEILFEPDARFTAFFEMGTILAELDRPDEAIEALRGASMIDESNVDVMHGLISLYEQTEQWIELVDQLERLAQTAEPEQRVQLLSRIGAEYVTHLDDAPQAIGAYERALALAPDDLELLRAIEPLYSQVGELDKLSDVLDRQLAQASSEEDRVRVMVSRARIAYEHYQQTEEAIELFKQAYEISPTSSVITEALDELYRAEERWVDLFNLYYEQLNRTEDAARRADLSVEMAVIGYEKLGDAATADQYLDFALGLDPKHMRALELKEAIFTAQGDWGQVSHILGLQFQASEDDEARIAVLLKRAALYRDTLGQSQDAIDDYVEVLNIDIHHAGAYENLTLLLNQLEAWEQLYEVMNFRVNAMPEEDQKQMYLDMAEVARKLGDTSRRLDALEAAYQFDTTDLDVVSPLLDAAIAGGHFDRAEPLLEEVITSLTEKRRMKDVVRFYHLRGKLYQQRGDEDAAFEAFEAARKIDATYVPNLLSLGKMLHDRQDWDAALKIFQTLLLHQMSIKDNQDKIDMYYYLGQVRLQKGDARRAKDMFNRALSIDANHEPSRQALASL